MPPVTNNFAVDYNPAGTVVDINNPPQKRYIHQEFPKMVYHHESGHMLEVKSAIELKLALKRGFNEKPASDRDYHLAKPGRVAPMKLATEPREVALSSEELVELEGDDPEISAETADEETGEQQEEQRPRRGRR